MSVKPLGKVTRTSRGFEIVKFSDHYGDQCSLQASSLAVYLKPGTSAVWLGCDDVRRHPATGEMLSPRMHLNQNQVAALIAYLYAWLRRDTFNFSPRRQRRPGRNPKPVKPCNP